MRILILFFFIIFLNGEQISTYNVKIKVLDDGKLDIQETILYDFTPNKRHGIFRNIPLNNNQIDLIDITQDNKPATYKTTYSNSDVIYRIGDKDILLQGKHLYTLHYIMDRVVFKKDNLHNAISFNAIGTGWKVGINNIKIDIFLPTKLATAKFVVFAGNKGSDLKFNYKQLSSTHYQIYKKHLAPHQGITFDLYFDKNLMEVKELKSGWAIFYLILFTIAIYFYYTKHKIPYIAVSPQYYPPKDLDILKVGLLIDQTADSKDFSSAILELATKGYLKIITTKDTFLGVFSKEMIVLRKLKSSEGLDFDAKKLFDSLFPKNHDEFVLGEKDITTARRLSNMVSSVNNWLYSWSVKAGYMKENPKEAKTAFIIKTGLVSLPAIILGFWQVMNFYGDMIIVEVVCLVFIMISIFIILQKGVIGKIFGTIFGIFGILILSETDIPFFNPLIITLLSIIPIIIFSNKISNYSLKGIKTLKYLLGLKEFILKVEKDKLEFLLKENPNYLDEMLPYAVLFGAKHWFSFYDEFNIDTNWYEGESIYFYELDRQLYESFDKSASYTESSNTTNSFSGGGSVGGGSGGGGGGSW